MDAVITVATTSSAGSVSILHAVCASSIFTPTNPSTMPKPSFR
jgi:hypothetical protein